MIQVKDRFGKTYSIKRGSARTIGQIFSKIGAAINRQLFAVYFDHSILDLDALIPESVILNKDHLFVVDVQLDPDIKKSPHKSIISPNTSMPIREDDCTEIIPKLSLLKKQEDHEHERYNGPPRGVRQFIYQNLCNVA